MASYGFLIVNIFIYWSFIVVFCRQFPQKTTHFCLKSKCKFLLVKILIAITCLKNFNRITVFSRRKGCIYFIICCHIINVFNVVMKLWSNLIYTRLLQQKIGADLEFLNIQVQVSAPVQIITCSVLP